MKVTRLPLIVITFLLSCFGATAQRDTSRLDLGWLSLDRSLTQTIRVKGADLEKMPFVNLADAISAWFYGGYTTPGMLAYIVDGNPVTDVNLYSIYDIEEVELVQNATGAAAYGSSQQNLVVITTKRGKEKGGFRMVGQTGPVNANGDGAKTFTNVYHQYYLGGYRNLGKLSYGVSANWIRDVFPAPAESYDHVSTPLNLQRWRFNGYLRWQPAEGQRIEFRMGYAPQRIDEALDSSQVAGLVSTVNDRVREHLVAPQIHWNWEILPGLHQELQVNYVGASTDLAWSRVDSSSTYANKFGILDQAKTGQFFANERLGYTVKTGDWMVRPAVNLSYNHIDEKVAYAISTFNISGIGTVVLPPVLGPSVEQKGDLLFLSPALEIGFRRAIDLQAGVLMDLHTGADYKKTLPFASLGVDVLGFGRVPNEESLKLFGSYAERTQMYVDDYSLLDLSGGGSAYSLGDVQRPKYSHEFLATGGGGTVDTIFNQYVPVQYPTRFRVYQGGVTYTLGKVVRVSYSYEHREFFKPGNHMAFISNNPASSIAIAPTFKSQVHHVDVRVRVTGDKALVWETGLAATALQFKQYYVFPPTLMLGVSSEEVSAPTGEWYPAKYSWTGGFVNRLSVGGFEAGLDLLYHFGETANNPFGGASSPEVNSLMTPNVYLGYRWKVARGRMLELFLDSRGLIRKTSSTLLDARRYYTVGGNFSL